MDPLSGLALAAPAGLNAYIPLLVLAVSQHFGWVDLSQPYDLIGTWWAMAVIAVLLVVEVVADKLPPVDHVNDAIQTVIRPAAGGLLGLSASGQGQLSPWILLLTGILLAGGVHTVKATARPVVNLSTAGTGAPVVSTAEDVAASVISVLALAAPVVAAVVIVGALLAVLLALRRLRRRWRRPTSP